MGLPQLVQNLDSPARPHPEQSFGIVILYGGLVKNTTRHYMHGRTLPGKLRARVGEHKEPPAAQDSPFYIAMARPVSVRVRHNRGALQLTGLDPATTLEMLRHMIAQRLELPHGVSFHRASSDILRF